MDWLSFLFGAGLGAILAAITFIVAGYLMAKNNGPKRHDT